MLKSAISVKAQLLLIKSYLPRVGTNTPEAKEAILPEMEDSAFSLPPPVLQPPFNLGLPRKRLCFCWLRLTKDEQD